MDLTKAQSAAIEASGKTVLVSAAAGSGKTFTLTQRIISKLLGENGKKADISRMLIVTFTRSAAQDLKVKISKALSKAIAEHPDNDYLQHQMLLLGDAKICTIDSFFTEPVKANFEKLGLPASVRLADEAELDDARLEIMNGVLDKMYKKVALGENSIFYDVNVNDDLFDLLGAIAGTKRISGIIPILIDIHSDLMSTIDGVELLKKNAERLKAEADKDFFETKEGKIIQSKAIAVCELAAEKFDYQRRDMEKDSFVNAKYSSDFDSYKTSCLALSNKCLGTYSDAQEAFKNNKFKSLTRMSKSEEHTPYSLECKDAKDKISKSLKTFATKNLCFTPEEIRKQMLLTAKYNELLYEIISAFDIEFTAYKKEKGLCEFSDMPKYLLKILMDESLSVKDEMQKMYDEVYIDEYQDVNEIQDKIFEIIGGDRRFMVGDIKQSIYGFRDAVPELFNNYRIKFPKYDDPNPARDDGCTIFMSENFRCDRSVIDFSNSICSYLFVAAGEKLKYTSDDDLKFAKKDLPEGYIPPKVQINIIENYTAEDVDFEDSYEDIENEKETDNADIPKEAILIAKEIHRLVREEKRPDPDQKGKMVPITMGDIAILVREKKYAPKVAKALKKYGIEYCLSAKCEIFDGEDMKAILDLLRVIDNPEDDIALSGFLTSSAYCGNSLFSFGETVTIRKFTPDSKSLMGALRSYAELWQTKDPLATLLAKRAFETVKLLDDLRAYSRRVSVEKLLKHLAAIDDFDKICDTNAYIYLYDTACNYVKNSWSGLYSFLKFCKKVSEKGSASYNEAAPSSAVNIMTIHQSKGLERNSIFICDTAKAFPEKAEQKATLSYNPELCCATKLPVFATDDDGNSYVNGYTDSVLRNAIIYKNLEDSLLENMRVLYVALTRARERLYISAELKSTLEKYKDEILRLGYSSFSKLAQKSFLTWIISALNDPLNNVDPDSFALNTFNASEISSLDAKDYNPLDKKNNLTQSEQKYLDVMLTANRNAKDEKPINIPSKIPASKATPNLFDLITTNKDATEDEGKQAILARIELMRSQSKVSYELINDNAPTAADRGTATHALLQFCDFGLIKHLGVQSEIDRLVENKFITKEASRLINKKQIEKFVHSSFFEKLLESHKLRREFKFSLFCPAESFAQDEELKKSLLGKQVYVQGSIDILAEYDNGDIYICDYKTDRIAYDENESHLEYKARLISSYSHQLTQYKHAVKTIFGKDPEKIYIYSLPLGEAIEINI